VTVIDMQATIRVRPGARPAGEETRHTLLKPRRNAAEDNRLLSVLTLRALPKWFRAPGKTPPVNALASIAAAAPRHHPARGAGRRHPRKERNQLTRLPIDGHRSANLMKGSNPPRPDCSGFWYSMDV
jgi:hypothetical protein